MFILNVGQENSGYMKFISLDTQILLMCPFVQRELTKTQKLESVNTVCTNVMIVNLMTGARIAEILKMLLAHIYSVETDV
jgi:hypothetical protein